MNLKSKASKATTITRTPTHSRTPRSIRRYRTVYGRPSGGCVSGPAKAANCS